MVVAATPSDVTSRNARASSPLSNHSLWAARAPPGTSAPSSGYPHAGARVSYQPPNLLSIPHRRRCPCHLARLSTYVADPGWMTEMSALMRPVGNDRTRLLVRRLPHWRRRRPRRRLWRAEAARWPPRWRPMPPPGRRRGSFHLPTCTLAIIPSVQATMPRRTRHTCMCTLQRLQHRARCL